MIGTKKARKALLLLFYQWCSVVELSITCPLSENIVKFFLFANSGRGHRNLKKLKMLTAKVKLAKSLHRSRSPSIDSPVPCCVCEGTAINDRTASNTELLLSL